MPTSSESRDGDVELFFTRDAEIGYVLIEVVTFEDEEHARTLKLGAFDTRDLLIALHALTVAPASPVAPLPAKPAQQARRPFWNRIRRGED